MELFKNHCAVSLDRSKLSTYLKPCRCIPTGTLAIAISINLDQLSCEFPSNVFLLFSCPSQSFFNRSFINQLRCVSCAVQFVRSSSQANLACLLLFFIFIGLTRFIGQLHVILVLFKLIATYLLSYRRLSHSRWSLC